ncbi:MAG: flagellar biosynthetic protein FliQ [Phycisphaerales bacterium]|nr:flagellar biosynthetic protein FliQ [Phycisphaerales bacterium]
MPAYDDSSVMLVREMLLIVLKIGAPILVAGMAVGLLISIVQSVTSIQDQTLTIVPKLTVMVIAAALLIPWIIQRLIDYAAAMLTFSQ